MSCSLKRIVDEYVAARAPGWLVLSAEECYESALRAVRFYAAYGSIRSIADDPAFPIRKILAISIETEVTVSEWALIMPLFVLYVEEQNAYRLEASRTGGLDPYGRQVGEIKSEIQTVEEQMAARAFCQPVRILGFQGGATLPAPYYFTSPQAFFYPLLPADGA